ncbi:MAG: TonB-dependent siderophore receptor [Cyanobacteria bacterium J06635_15]
MATLSSPVHAALFEITQVELTVTDGGVELRLAVDDSRELQVFQIQSGTTWAIDIPNAQLVDSAAFEQIGVSEAIASVSVQPLENGGIRVTVVSQEQPLLGTVETRDRALALTITREAVAQADPADADSPNADPGDVASPPDAPPNGDALQIVVTGEALGSAYVVPQATTATRTETPLLEIPQSIQVIPQQVLEDQQVIRLDEALRNVSGVVADTTEGAGFQFSVRGFPSARLLRDGFSLSGSDALSNTGILALPEIANVEQLEVLKGPASILYGEIQPGGVINLVTEQPTPEPLYEAELQLGSRSLIRPQLDFSDRLTADGRLRYRFNALVQREDGFRDFNQGIEREFIAPVVAWNISDRTTLTLDFEYLRDERPNDAGLLAFGQGVVDVPRDRIVGEPDDVVERSFITTGYRLVHQFSDTWQVRHAFRHSNQTYSSNFFLPLTFNETTGIVARLGGGTEWYQDFYGLQTDVVGNFTTGSIEHTLLFGIDLSRDRSDIESRVNLAALSPLDIFNPTYGNVQRLPFEQLLNPARVQDVTTSRLGLFLQDQIELFETVNLLAGIRYDTVSQAVTNAPSLFDATGSESRQTVDAVTPRFGLVYQPIPEIAVYASYSQSFTPSSATNLAGNLLEPETGEGLEIGFKTELFNQRLIATLAYFDITRQNVATLDPNAPPLSNASVATGEQRSQGIELDLSGEILPGWQVIANYAYTDARVTQDNAIPLGNGLAGIPEHSANVWTTYTLQDGDLAGLGFGLGFNYVGERPGDLNNSFRLDEYWVTNAAIFYDRNDFQLALNFKNLFNTNYIQGTPISRVRGIEPGEPFTIVGSISFRF